MTVYVLDPSFNNLNSINNEIHFFEGDGGLKAKKKIKPLFFEEIIVCLLRLGKIFCAEEL